MPAYHSSALLPPAWYQWASPDGATASSSTPKSSMGTICKTWSKCNSMLETGRITPRWKETIFTVFLLVSVSVNYLKLEWFYFRCSQFQEADWTNVDGSSFHECYSLAIVSDRPTHNLSVSDSCGLRFSVPFYSPVLLLKWEFLVASKRRWRLATWCFFGNLCGVPMPSLGRWQTLFAVHCARFVIHKDCWNQVIHSFRPWVLSQALCLKVVRPFSRPEKFNPTSHGHRSIFSYCQGKADRTDAGILQNDSLKVPRPEVSPWQLSFALDNFTLGITASSECVIVPTLVTKQQSRPFSI